MTTTQTNYGFSLSHNWITSYFTAPTNPLLEKLNAPLSSETLQEVVAYLEDHSDAGLEQALKEKLAKTDSPKTLSMVKSVCEFSLREDRLKMLEVCKRIVSLDQLKSALKINDPITIARRESSIIPLPTRRLEKISDTAIQNWHKYSSIFGKIIHCIQVLIMAIIITVASAVTSPLKNPPSTIGGVDMLVTVYQAFFKWVNQLTTSYLELFDTTKTAALVGVVILIAAIAINHIHTRFRFGVPESIDKKEHFKNTTIEAQNGQIKEMKGRQTERGQVSTAWNVPQSGTYRFALLIGPPGSGKTEFVKGLAWESVNKTDSFVFGKKIFTINTANLVKEGTNYLGEILANIKGYEDDIVLFFDECHTAGALENKPGGLLIETLKTALIDNNIRAIFATTNKEYEDNIAHNLPFVDRCIKIDFKELPNTESKQILKDQVELDVARVIDVDADAYDALLSVASNKLEGYNPRKVINLYNNIRDYVYSWAPKQLSRNLDRLTAKRDDLHAECKTANNDPDWSNSATGIKLLNKLGKKESKIQKLNGKLKTQKVVMDGIARLRKLGPQYRKQYNSVVHQVVAETKPAAQEELQKEFLYLKHILRPALQGALAAEANSLKTHYQEELPLKIDAALIKTLYPEVFNIPKDASEDSSQDT